MDFWGSLEDANADCAAAAAPRSAVFSGHAGAVDSSPTENGATKSSFEGETLAEGGEGDGATEGGCRGRKAARRRALTSVRCEDCSLVVFEGAAYYDAWHGIASTAGGGDNSSAATSGALTTADAAEAAVAGAVVNGEEGGSKGSQDDAAAPGAQAAAPSHSSGGGVARDREGGAARKRLSFTIRRVARVVPADSVMEHSEARSEMERRRRGFERSVTETGVAALPRDR